MADGQVVFEISADNRSAIRAINDTTEALEDAGRDWEQSAGGSTDKIGNSFSDMFKKIGIAAAAAKVGQKLLEIGKNAIDLASDLQEVQNVVDVTFGDNASKIDSWAKSAASSFGLTELQAKQFTSTLGAMMKSSGLAGDEIVEMSESLSGLAADMASFYNLDFETAFQKIRSGISGETEPLKVLGINLSVANLEAFALQQGLSKTFSEMSQGEQTLLRYQYLMQATSDAQGDFARTSGDSLANMKRQFETNLTTISSQIGEFLITPLTKATGFLTEFLNKLTDKKETILDRINKIDIDKETKIANIQAVAEEARALKDTLNTLDFKTDDDPTAILGRYLSGFAGSVKELNTELSSADTTKLNLEKLAQGLSTKLDGDPEKWETLLTAIKDNAEDAIAAASGDTGATQKFLEGVAAGADDLDTDYSAYWSDLLSVLGAEAEDAITAIANGENTGGILEEIASGANVLNAGTSRRWQNFVDAIDGITVDGAANLDTVAGALSTDLGGDASKWENLLKAIGGNAKAAIEATQGDSAKTKEFLENVAAGADDLTTDYSPYWSALLTALGDNAEAAFNNLEAAVNAGANLGAIAGGANLLKSNTPGLWLSILGTLQTIDGLENIFDNNAAGNVTDLANALSDSAPNTDKSEAWKTFLDALGSNAGALTQLTGQDAAGTVSFLSAIRAEAEKIEPTDADAWNKLLGTFISGLPGLFEGDAGETFFEQMRTNFLAMGNESEDAISGLMMLGMTSDEIAIAQDRWLTICQQLVKTIPGLSSIIDTQTGKINGGTKAVEDYIDAWEQEKILAAQIEAIQEKRAALEQELNINYKTEMIAKRATAKGYLVGLEGVSEEQAEKYLKMKEALEMWGQLGGRSDIALGNMHPEAILEAYGENGEEMLKWSQQWLDNLTHISGDFDDKTEKALKDYNSSIDNYVEAQKIYPQVIASYDKDIQQMQEDYNMTEEEILNYGKAVEEAAESTSILSQAANENEDAMNTVKTAVQNAEDALKNLADYQEQVRSQIASTVRGIVSGFAEVETAGMRLERERAELKTKAENEEGKYTKEEVEAFNKQLAQMSDPVSVQQMIKGLESQEKYMRKYQDYLNEAKARGVSDTVLAYLSDGSQESFDYLKALATDKNADIQKINELYASVQSQSELFTNNLTDQKLVADEAYKSLLETAQEAINGLDLGDEAYNSVTATIDGIVRALGDKSAEVQTQVNGILAQIARLTEMGGGLTGFGVHFTQYGLNFNGWYGGRHANGIDNVPFDGYLALLHQGERVQTAAEADLSRRYTYQQPAFDYDAMGGAIGANISGGNVYLDGQTVGRIISNRQADSYRALERSGWQG